MYPWPHGDFARYRDGLSHSHRPSREFPGGSDLPNAIANAWRPGVRSRMRLTNMAIRAVEERARPIERRVTPLHTASMGREIVTLNNDVSRNKKSSRNLPFNSARAGCHDGLSSKIGTVETLATDCDRLGSRWIEPRDVLPVRIAISRIGRRHAQADSDKKCSVKRGRGQACPTATKGLSLTTTGFSKRSEFVQKQAAPASLLFETASLIVAVAFSASSLASLARSEVRSFRRSLERPARWAPCRDLLLSPAR
jgi:hypothetical protein